MLKAVYSTAPVLHVDPQKSMWDLMKGHCRYFISVICTTEGGILCKYNQFVKGLGSSSAPSWLWSTRAHPSFCLPPGCHLFNTSLTPPVTYFTSSSGPVFEHHPLPGLLLLGRLLWVKPSSVFAVQRWLTVYHKYWTVWKCNNIHLWEGGPALICVLSSSVARLVLRVWDTHPL